MPVKRWWTSKNDRPSRAEYHAGLGISLSNTYKIAIIGGGNGGQTMAGHFGLLGHEVSLYNCIWVPVAAIAQQGGVLLKEAIQGFGWIRRGVFLLELSGMDSCVCRQESGERVLYNPRGLSAKHFSRPRAVRVYGSDYKRF